MYSSHSVRPVLKSHKNRRGEAVEYFRTLSLMLDDPNTGKTTKCTLFHPLKQRGCNFHALFFETCQDI